MITQFTEAEQLFQNNQLYDALEQYKALLNENTDLACRMDPRAYRARVNKRRKMLRYWLGGSGSLSSLLAPTPGLMQNVLEDSYSRVYAHYCLRFFDNTSQLFQSVV